MLTAKTTARNSVTDRLSKIEKPGPIFLSKTESMTKRERKIFVCLDICADPKALRYPLEDAEESQESRP